MTDEILYQGPGYTIARTDEAETLVPYGPAVRSEGTINHGWFDLRGRPDLVDAIPEAQRSAGLRSLLRVIADPASKIMSSACECWPFEQPERGDAARWQVGGFVETMFHDPQTNTDPQNLVDLAVSILQGIGETGEHVVGYEMIVEPLRSFFGRRDCYALMIKPLGYGATEETAWMAFDHAAQGVADSIQHNRDRRAAVAPATGEGQH